MCVLSSPFVLESHAQEIQAGPSFLDCLALPERDRKMLDIKLLANNHIKTMQEEQSSKFRNLKER